MRHDGKRNVLGVLVDVIDYEAASEQIVSAALEGRSVTIAALAVHGVISAVKDPLQAERLNGFDLLTPDGQPLRWALNSLHRVHLTDRVAGPDLTKRLLSEAQRLALPVFFYGSTPATLSQLVGALTHRYPRLTIAGVEPSRFREVRVDEADEIATRIRESGARLVFVGLGCPRQELFVHNMRSRLDIPLVAVGAAFDFEAGTLRRAPDVLRRVGLEWAWRLAAEPRRLWRRYMVDGSEFLLRWAHQRVAADRYPAATPARARLDDAFPA